MIDHRTPVVHFLHISKTGGTAVKHALHDSLALTRCALLLHGHRVKLMDVPDGEKAAFFLRDPVSRFCSGFYSRKRQGRPRFDFPWSPAEELAFGRFSTPVRQLSGGFVVPEDACISYETLYKALETLELDLHQHIHLENNILFPRAVEMETAG